MSEAEIIKLFFDRNEAAVTAVKEKYGGLCFCIAESITGSSEDAEECVNDAYLRLWNSIPPVKPENLSAYAAKITRNLAINSYNRSKNKNPGIQLVFEELQECLAAPDRDFDRQETKQILDSFLASLKADSRVLFVKRYFFSKSVSQLCDELGMKESAVKMRLSRIRMKLRIYLEKEGVCL
ncbi:MAG: RNA polymerase sigma factor [Acutalibacteraceae bacterium]